MKLWSINDKTRLSDNVTCVTADSVFPAWAVFSFRSWQVWWDKVTSGRRGPSGGDGVFVLAAFGGYHSVWSGSATLRGSIALTLQHKCFLFCDWHRVTAHEVGVKSINVYKKLLPQGDGRNNKSRHRNALFIRRKPEDGDHLTTEDEVIIRDHTVSLRHTDPDKSWESTMSVCY